MKATIDDTVIADADDGLVIIEGNYYFPPSSLVGEPLEGSPTPYVCPWKGAAQYHNVRIGHHLFRDAAWSYPTPCAPRSSVSARTSVATSPSTGRK